jgi:photosynthetic reaction center M subunit
VVNASHLEIKNQRRIPMKNNILMVEYQNLFTQVQPVGPVLPGIPLGKGNSPRTGEQPWIFHILGRIGNAQVGPIYLGGLGIASIICFILAFTMIGMNYLAQVGWSPIQLVKQLFWLSLDPPNASYGLRIPPMNEGGWFLMVGAFFSASLIFWWFRTYRRATELGMGHHVAWAFAALVDICSGTYSTNFDG